MICAGRCRRYTQRWQAKSNQSLGIFSMNFARSRCDRAADHDSDDTDHGHDLNDDDHDDG